MTLDEALEHLVREGKCTRSVRELHQHFSTAVHGARSASVRLEATSLRGSWALRGYALALEQDAVRHVMQAAGMPAVSPVLLESEALFNDLAHVDRTKGSTADRKLAIRKLGAALQRDVLTAAMRHTRLELLSAELARVTSGLPAPGAEALVAPTPPGAPVEHDTASGAGAAPEVTP